MAFLCPRCTHTPTAGLCHCHIGSRKLDSKKNHAARVSSTVRFRDIKAEGPVLFSLYSFLFAIGAFFYTSQFPLSRSLCCSTLKIQHYAHFFFFDFWSQRSRFVKWTITYFDLKKEISRMCRYTLTYERITFQSWTSNQRSYFIRIWNLAEHVTVWPASQSVV